METKKTIDLLHLKKNPNFLKNLTFMSLYFNRPNKFD